MDSMTIGIARGTMGPDPLSISKKNVYGPTGAIWVATDYHQVVKSALSFALSGEVSRSVQLLSNTEQDNQHTRHKEETEGRIKTDQADRQSLRDTLGCLH